LILTNVVAAIRATVADYTARVPGQPWHLDRRPGAADLTAAVDAVLDDVLEVALVRPVDGMPASFPSRFITG
jgi:hypothetical protein